MSSKNGCTGWISQKHHVGPHPGFQRRNFLRKAFAGNPRPAFCVSQASSELTFLQTLPAKKKAEEAAHLSKFFFLYSIDALILFPFPSSLLSFSSRLMEALQIAAGKTSAGIARSSPPSRSRLTNSRVGRFTLPLSIRRSEGGFLCVRRCVKKGRDEGGGGFRSSQDRSSAIEEREGSEVIFGKEKDSSVIGFRQVDLAGNKEAVDFTTNAVTAREGEGEEKGGEEEGKSETRITHNIVFVTAEAAPYSKTGGLGDVCGSLPIALAARGHRVMVVSPRYLNGVLDGVLAGASDVGCCIKTFCFGAEQEVSFFHEYRAGVDWVFVDHACYQRPGNPYGDSFGAFGDNQFRFTLLCHAACEAPLVLPLGGFTYGEKCLFLVNDWHASLVPVLLAAKYRPHGVYQDARSILIIHNLAHQGVEPGTTYMNLGLPPEWYGALEWVFPTWARKHALDKGEAVNALKGAVVTADRILTVSQGYSWEITTSEGGYGLHELLASRKSVLNGITNGINVDEWDPASDKYVPFHYSVSDLSGKVKCKTALQKELGLDVRPDCPMIGFIGRLDYQKGIDLIRLALPELMQEDVQFVMLGSGDPEIEEWMRSAESIYKDKFRGWVGFNVPISHRITAGCDILLMPSRFEPCGLNQLYAMRYGTVPVVHCTGGLRDTVENFSPYADDGRGQGTGWTFSPLTMESMLVALEVAIRTYREHKSSWEGLMKRGMTGEYTWDKAAVQYEQVFEWAFTDLPYVR